MYPLELGGSATSFLSDLQPGKICTIRLMYLLAVICLLSTLSFLLVSTRYVTTEAALPDRIVSSHLDTNIRPRLIYTSNVMQMQFLLLLVASRRRPGGRESDVLFFVRATLA
jgi:hypothetical protein